MMTARPQTVGYGATDSPAGLAAWVLVHPGFAQWTYGADPAKSPTKDDVLDNITLYWLTNTATSAARLYWENGARGSVIVAAAQKTSEISLPVAITVFPEDVYRPPETWARRAYRNLIYFHEVDKGGHFAAWEQPSSSARSSGPRSDHFGRQTDSPRHGQTCTRRSNRAHEYLKDEGGPREIDSNHGASGADRRNRLDVAGGLGAAGIQPIDLQRHDLSAPGREVIQVRVELDRE